MSHNFRNILHRTNWTSTVADTGRSRRVHLLRRSQPRPQPPPYASASRRFPGVQPLSAPPFPLHPRAIPFWLPRARIERTSSLPNLFLWWRSSAIASSSMRAGLSNGIFINGMAAMPNIGVSSVVVSGFTVKNANFEGILVANAYDITLTGNHVLDNDKALSGGACPGLPDFETSEGEDCGEGIHLMSDLHSSVVRNTVEHNAGGILITDETGVNRGNLVSGNVVQDNVWDCGITMASHPPAISIGPGPAPSFGVFNNTISHNISARNGVSGSGAGVGIFAPSPGHFGLRQCGDRQHSYW